MNIYQEAKNVMKRKGWTQGQLAEAIGVHEVSLSRLLNGHFKKRSAYQKLVDFVLAQNNKDVPQRTPDPLDITCNESGFRSSCQHNTQSAPLE